MKKSLVILALLLAPAVLGVRACWWRSYALPHRLSLARAALGTREGASLLEGLVRDDPENLEILLLQAKQLRLEGKTDLALTRLNQAAERGASVEQVEREQTLLLAQTDFARAEPLLQGRLDFDAHDRDALLALAFGYAMRGQAHMAELLADRVLEGNPEDGTALCIRGGIRERERHLAQAREDLEKALRLGPGQYYLADARLLLANCLLDLGEFEESQTLYRQCRTEEPANPRVLYGLGCCAIFLKNWEEALEAFQAVLDLRPGHFDTLLQLAYVHEQRGELARALERLEQARGQNPDRAEVYFRMAKILRVLGQPERAAQCQARYDEINKPSLSRSGAQTDGEYPEKRDAASMPRNLMSP